MHGLLLIQRDGRLSWLTFSEQFTHKVVTCQPGEPPYLQPKILAVNLTLSLHIYRGSISLAGDCKTLRLRNCVLEY